MFCKTIILSNSQNLTNNAPKGILTLSKESNAIKGKIRLYNVVSLPPLTKIGLYINEKVYISAINKKTNYYEFELKENIDITQSIYCALIDNSDNDKKVLLEGGSFNGFYFTDSPFDSVLEAKDEEIEQTIDEALKQSDKCETCNCENCEYKKYFYQNNNLASENIMEIKNKTNKSPLLDDLNTSGNRDLKTNDTATDTFQTNVIEKLEQELVDNIKSISQAVFNNKCLDKKENTDILPDSSLLNDETNTQMQEKLNFLDDIVYQLDEMFDKYPEENILNEIIPNSKFIRIESENPYVLGAIYENDNLQYIAYGVPAQYNSQPPADLGKHYQWLPLNPRDTMSDGYFMIYQDAINGSIIEIQFDE